jgi:hypothetical protein
MWWVWQTQTATAEIAIIAFLLFYLLPWLAVGEITILQDSIRFTRFYKTYQYHLTQVEGVSNFYWFPWELIFLKVNPGNRPLLLVAFDEADPSGHLIPFWRFKGRLAILIKEHRISSYGSRAFPVRNQQSIHED